MRLGAPGDPAGQGAGQPLRRRALPQPVHGPGGDACRGAWSAASTARTLTYAPTHAAGRADDARARPARRVQRAGPVRRQEPGRRPPVLHVGAHDRLPAQSTRPRTTAAAIPSSSTSCRPSSTSRAYTFFTDPTYPETNLVLVREQADGGAFADVTPRLRRHGHGLAADRCRATQLEYARIDLVTGNFQPVRATATTACTSRRARAVRARRVGLGQRRDRACSLARRQLRVSGRRERQADQHGRHPVARASTLTRQPSEPLRR